MKEQTQKDIRRKLVFGCYVESNNTSRTAYAINLYLEAKELEPLDTEKEFISNIARHFNEKTKYAMIGRGIADLSTYRLID